MWLLVKSIGFDDVFLDMARLHSSHRSRISAGKVLKLSVNGRTKLLVARGAPKNERSVIWLDLKTRKELLLEVNKGADFKIEEASFVDNVKWAWNASDPAYRISSRLGVLSFFLGIIGFVLGVLSLCVK